MDNSAISGSTCLAGELDTNVLRGLKLPREVGHDIDSVGTTDTDGAHAETTSVGSVRISADQKTTRESVVLKDNLVNDTRARAPEADVVLGASRGKEIVDLLVDLVSARKILFAAVATCDQMVCAALSVSVRFLGGKCG